jgi:hypothetical protein
MNTVKYLSVVPRITRDQIMEFSPAERYELGTANGISVVPKSERVKEFLRGFEMTDADKIFVLQHANDKNPIERAHVHTESFVNNHGGQQEASATQIELTSVNGQKFTRPNTVIPLPFDVKLTRPLMRLAVMAATFLQVKNKKVGIHWAYKDLQKAWKDTTVNVAGLARFQKSMMEILMKDAAFVMRLNGATSSISSDDFLLSCAAVLNRCALADYIAINQIVVYEVFRFFEMRVTNGGKIEWRRYKVRVGKEKKPYIPDSCLMDVRAMFPSISEEMMGMLEAVRIHCKVPKLLFATGVIDASHNFQEPLGTLESVIKGHQVGVSLRQGEDVGTSRLYDMQGFTGLMDDFGIRISLLTSMALGVHDHFKAQGKADADIVIDIEMHSTGDAGLLCHSLQCHMPAVNWKLRVPKAGDWVKIHRDLHKFLIEIPRSEAVYVKFSSVEFQTFPSIGDYRMKSDQEVPRHECLGYVMYIPVFGPYWWHTAEKAKIEKAESSLRESNSFIPVPVPKKPVRVLAYGSGARLRGIVTNLTSFSLIGQSKRAYVPITLKCYESESAWYKYAVESMGSKNCFWVNPYSHYSPITNLVVSSKATVIYARTTPVMAEDAYTGDVSVAVEGSEDSDDGEGWEQVGEGSGELVDFKDHFPDAPPEIMNPAEQVHAAEQKAWNSVISKAAPPVDAPREKVEKKPSRSDEKRGKPKDKKKKKKVPRHNVRQDSDEDDERESSSDEDDPPKKIDFSSLDANLATFVQ